MHNDLHSTFFILGEPQGYHERITQLPISTLIPHIPISFFLLVQEYDFNCCHNFDVARFVSLVQQDLNIILEMSE